jgi:hypothetical protein
MDNLKKELEELGFEVGHISMFYKWVIVWLNGKRYQLDLKLGNKLTKKSKDRLAKILTKV